jgi:hypothetical protein
MTQWPDDSKELFVREARQHTHLVKGLFTRSPVHPIARLVDTLHPAVLQRYQDNLQPSRAVVVGVAQLVERQTVDLDVAGSNPVTHPIFRGTTASTFNPLKRLSIGKCPSFAHSIGFGR